uniref:Photosystem II D1 processing protein PSB27-H2, chloroplastic n=1 Tax=Opuntia streptacantha TaxID=393608 RepID=A0A7C9DNE2_OPUST
MALHLPKGWFPTSWCSCVRSRADKWNSSHHLKLLPWESQLNRRQLCIGTSLIATLSVDQSIISQPVQAEEKAVAQEEESGIIGTIKSLFDPNEKTKTGKLLPKAYLKSAREVVKTLRESLKEDPKDMGKFRRTADAAKKSIREYLSNWKGQPTLTKR